MPQERIRESIEAARGYLSEHPEEARSHDLRGRGLELGLRRHSPVGAVYRQGARTMVVIETVGAAP